jgi:hypothetical protein
MYDNESGYIYDPEPAQNLVNDYMDLQREVHAAVRKVLDESKYFYLKGKKEIVLEVIFDQVEEYVFPKIEHRELSRNGYDMETNYADL